MSKNTNTAIKPANKKKLRLSDYLSFSVKDFLTSLCIFGGAVGICVLLQRINASDGFASPIFVLAVLLISRFTTGFFFGTLAAVLSVFFVNLIFTYPYWEINFTLAGYPLYSLSFLAVSIITSTLTTQTRQREKLLIENEKIQMRASLLRSVSHDIRTPLTSIIGSTSAVLENPMLTIEEQHTLLEDVRTEAQWLIQVVENLLSITRIGNNSTKIAKQDEAAEEILSEASRKFRKRFPGIQVSVDVPDEVLIVPMDPILIGQVLNNLMENAAVHGKNTTRIWLSLQKEGDLTLFSVRDNGGGIPEEELPTLFDGSRRATLSEGDGKRNMGLGLSVCMAIIQAHDGTLDAKNLKCGAEFTFRLPLYKEDSE